MPEEIKRITTDFTCYIKNSDIFKTARVIFSEDRSHVSGELEREKNDYNFEQLKTIIKRALIKIPNIKEGITTTPKHGWIVNNKTAKKKYLYVPFNVATNKKIPTQIDLFVLTVIGSPRPDKPPKFPDDIQIFVEKKLCLEEMADDIVYLCEQYKIKELPEFFIFV